MDINDNELNNANVDDNVGIEVTEANNNYNLLKEDGKAGLGDVESLQSDGSKTVESREDRIRRLKEQSELDRQRKLAEIIESQRQSHELRQKQQNERRKKIEELKHREEERRKGVEQRRKELDEKDKEKAENFQKRTKERQARAALSQRPVRTGMSTSMSQSMIAPRTNRMTTSVTSGTSSGSEKSGPATRPGTVPNRRSASNTRTPRQPPEGFLEVDGHFIPASTRHAGCFLPYQGPRYRVKGVLAWAPPRCDPPAATGSKAGMAWWASLSNDKSSTSRRTHQRASSVGAHGDDAVIRPSIPCNMNKAGLEASPHVNRRVILLKPSLNDKIGSISTTPRSVKMIKAFSQHHLTVAGSSSPREPVAPSPRINKRSTSRPSNIGPTNPPRPAAIKNKDDSIFDRLSKPRSGSQPPKSVDELPNKSMTSSFTKPSGRNETVKPKKDKVQSKPIQLEKPRLVEAINDEQPDLSEKIQQVDSNVTGGEEPSSKPGAMGPRPNKNLPRTPPDTNTESNAVVGEEVAYKLKLAEQRRIAREKKEEQMEEQRRIEEEGRQKAALEKKRMEEEARMNIEEEAKRTRLLEEERLAELERQRLIEEADKKKRDDDQRELEESRQEKLRLAEEERMDRKRRLEKIMSRVKRTDDSISPSNEDNTAGSEISELITTIEDKQDPIIEVSIEDPVLVPSKDESVEDDCPQPTEAWVEDKPVEEKVDNNHLSRGDSPEQLSEAVLDLSGPESQTTTTSGIGDSIQQPAPQFKSRLLQSMLGSGRLTNSASTNSFQADRAGRDKRNSSFVSHDQSDSFGSVDDSLQQMSHSQSYHGDMSHMFASNGPYCDELSNCLSFDVVPNGNHCAPSTRSESDSGPTNGCLITPSYPSPANSIEPPRLPVDKLEVRSESTYSQLLSSTDECSPASQLHHNRAAVVESS